jgi:hypothetical protein
MVLELGQAGVLQADYCQLREVAVQYSQRF